MPDKITLTYHSKRLKKTKKKTKNHNTSSPPSSNPDENGLTLMNDQAKNKYLIKEIPTRKPHPHQHWQKKENMGTVDGVLLIVGV